MADRPKYKMKRPHIVQPRSGRKRLFFGILLVGFLVLLLAAAFQYGRDWKGDSPAESGRKALVEQISELESDNADLSQKVTALERARQIDQEATREVKEQIIGLQDERLKLEEELVFVRGMVATGSTKDGLFIQRLVLKKTDKERQFQFKFTISQVLKDKGTAAGRIWISVDGRKEGKDVSLSFSKLSDSDEDSIKMRFKHYQDVDGLVTLPKGLTAKKLKIELKPTTKKLNGVTKVFPWKLEG